MALKDLLDRLRFRIRMLWFALTVLPVVGGSPDEGDEGDEGDKPDDKDGDKDGDEPEGKVDADKDGDEPEGDEGDKEPKKSADEYRRELRRYERNAKTRTERDRKRIADLEAKLKEREDADKSEQEKALEKARDEARSEAEKGFEAQRRQDRLEVAVTRAASRGFTVGEGDEKKTLKFADPEDALIYLERALAKDDLSSEDLYDDGGKIDADALSEALIDILVRKPQLATSNGSGPPPAGDADQGKGKGAGGTGLEDMTPEDHFQALTKGRK